MVQQQHIQFRSSSGLPWFLSRKACITMCSWVASRSHVLFHSASPAYAKIFNVYSRAAPEVSSIMQTSSEATGL